MLDPHLLRNQAEEVEKALHARGFKFDSGAFLVLEERRKSLQMATQALQNERNQLSKEIGFKKSRNEDIGLLLAEVSRIADVLQAHKTDLEAVLEEIEQISRSLPNLPHTSVPVGRDELQNKEIRRHGIVPTYDFKVKSHDELGEALDQMDFAVAAKITGSRFVVLKAQLARLQRALTQFMLDTHCDEHGYQELYVPYMVNKDSLMGTGQLPKLEEDLFKLTGDQNYYLIPTAEVPITNMVRDVILTDGSLPLRFVCHSPCFRSEAGSYGKDTKGMIRQHQFEKVELVWVTTPELSYDGLEQLTSHAEAILQRLELPYRVVALCTGDLGGSSAKTYDLEVWLPSQNTYREISSCSNMTDFQARRMGARYRTSQNRETTLVHTLNGSALAVGRTLVAIMENYQDKDGNIHIPEVLYPYMHGIKMISLQT
jgi:seryl-tRNA synthetase